jgi:transglutaminase-like putative cysteine protease
MSNTVSRYWLLAALVFAFIPHVDRLPWWLNGVLCVMLLWRLPAIEQRLPVANNLMKVLLLLAGIAGLKSTYNVLFGPEAGVSFLIFCVALKLIETNDERDSYVLLTLSFFVLATSFLFSKSLFITVYAGFALLIITSAYVSFNQSISSKYALKIAVVLLGQALPLMLILFVFFPRLPPLWTLKMTEGSGKTGMSDNMSPGDLAKLSQSSELAFRVEFKDNKIPPKTLLYWRGLTLSRFDGKTWRTSNSPWLNDYALTAWSQQPLPQWTEMQIRIKEKSQIQYKVILEPTDTTWLYALSVPYSNDKGIGLTRDFRLISSTPIFQRFTYNALRFDAVALDPELPEWLRQENLKLPNTGNPTARKMAREWHTFYGSDEKYITAVLHWFTKNQFYYTLEPPPLGNNRIDEFLFQTRRGFCEHYASSFTFLLRAAGIPARVVIGYQGGELSPTGDSWQVRQMDAHAWVEAWLPQKGWVKLDPTAAIAPERIERGMSDMAQTQEVWGDSALSAMKYGNYKLLGQLRNMADYLNYRWQRDVLGYDAGNQEEFLLKLLGDTQIWKRLVVMFGALVAIAGLLAAWTILKDRKKIHPADKVILKLSKQLSIRGLSRRQGEGVIAYLQRLQQQQPQWDKSLLLLQESYSAVRYQESQNHVLEIRKMARLLRTWPRYQPQKTKEL